MSRWVAFMGVLLVLALVVVLLATQVLTPNNRTDCSASKVDADKSARLMEFRIWLGLQYVVMLAASAGLCYAATYLQLLHKTFGAAGTLARLSGCVLLLGVLGGWVLFKIYGYSPPSTPTAGESCLAQALREARPAEASVLGGFVPRRVMPRWLTWRHLVSIELLLSLLVGIVAGVSTYRKARQVWNL